MKYGKTSHWFYWTCDLEGCHIWAATHPILAREDLEAETPLGWVTIKPPRYWRGPELAFCSVDHAEQFTRAVVVIQPQLAAVNG